MKTHTTKLTEIFSFELKITLSYLILGLLWILFSDRLLEFFVADVHLRAEFQTYKGFFFIFVTAAFLYLFAKTHMRSLRLAESKLIESESHYKTLFNNNHSVIVLINPDNARIEDANPAACEYYGCTHEQLCSKSVYDFNMLDEQTVDARLQGVKSEDQGHLFAKHRLTNGDIRDVEIYSSPIKIGDRTFIYSIIHDITEQKKAAEIISKSEERYRNTLDQMMEGCQIIDFNWNYVYLNRTAEIQNRKSNIELIGKCYMDVWPGIEDTHVFKQIEDVLFNKRVPIHFENEFQFSDGSKRWFDLSVQPIEEGVFILSIDITDRKQIESEIQQLNIELEQRVLERTHQLEMANKELEAFSYSVSHDLRAPLRHINGYVDLLTAKFSDHLPEKATYYLSVITDSTREMGILIDDLLRFSRTSRQDLHKINFDMNMLVNEVVDKVKEDEPLRRIVWSLQNLPQVFGDVAMLKQVWTNLISNAVKYTKYKETAEIKISYVVDKNNYVFSIRDNGVGFDMQYANKLFGVFQRLHSKDEFEGTGIGLAHVQRIIHKHNGKVWAEAEPDKGAVFYFSIRK